MSPTLPFLTTGELIEQGGAAVTGAGEIPLSIWPAVSSRNSATGRQHTHRGEADLTYRNHLRVANRSLVIEGEHYKIVSATPNTFVPHVVLELLLTAGRS